MRVNNQKISGAYAPQKSSQTQRAGSSQNFAKILKTKKKDTKAAPKASAPAVQVHAQAPPLLKSVKKFLTPDAQGNIHKEELQYALVSHFLFEESPTAGMHFQRIFGEVIGRGVPPLLTEDAVVLALRSVVAEGLLPEGRGEFINSISFQAAGPEDNFRAALISLDEGSRRADEVLQKIDAGEVSFETRSLYPGANATSSLSSGWHFRSDLNGFLWKPVSESDGNLVVLLPSVLRGQIETVDIHTELPPAPENRIETGEFVGDVEGGFRPHYRFDKPGSHYPDRIYVVASLSDGSQIDFPIGESSERHA